MKAIVAEFVKRLEKERDEINAILEAVQGNGHKKKKWSKAQRAKFMASMAKRRKQ